MSAFDYQVRVLLCPQCGAPIEVSPAGGATPCRFCGAHAQVQVRDESLDEVLRPQRQPRPEPERLAILRTQTGKELLPPGNIRHLFDGGSLATYRLNEAIAFWNGARHEAQSTGHPEAAEAVYFLAMALSGLYGLQNDAPRQRAVLESSLEALKLPRHRQAIRCMLSRLACKSGDAAAAEQWLAPCDAASDDLEVDSPYRFSRAVIATARGDFQGVLATVGRVPDEVPLLDAVHSTCVVFRANALERLGDVAGAARALEQHTSHRPDHQTLVDKTFDAWASFNLCPQSRGQAQVVERKERADVAAQASGGPIGIIFAVIGTSMSVVGIGLLVTALVVGLHKGSPSSPGPSAGRHGKSVPPAVVAANGAAKTAAAFAVALPGGILTLTGLIFGAIGYPLSRAAARAKRIALNGERAQAVVQAVKPTGISINHVPQYAVTLLVQRAGAAPPYTATTKTLAARAVVGATVPVVLDPEDPKHVQLDLS